MSGDKTKVAATALGVLVLGCGCYFVFAGDSGDKVQGVAGEIVSVARTPDPPADDKPRVQDDRRRHPQRPGDTAKPRRPGNPRKDPGQSRQRGRKPPVHKKKSTEPSC